MAGIDVYAVVQKSETVNVEAKSAAMLSGGSSESASLTRSLSTVSVQASPSTRFAAGSTVNVVGPPVTSVSTVPLTEQTRLTAPPASETGSLKVTVGVTAAWAVAPFAGVTDATVGAVSGTGSDEHVAVWLPSPSKVSVAYPVHWADGSKALLPSGSPAQTSALRRKVSSAVLARPVPHSVPGSTPSWPMTSSTVVPLRSTTASSPLNQPDPFVWSAWARIVALAPDWARTKTSPAATVPLRLTVRPALALPLKYICTE